MKRWDIVENKWLQAGVPLTITRVPGKGHQWMLTDEPLKETFQWLDQLKAGKLPTSQVKSHDMDI